MLMMTMTMRMTFEFRGFEAWRAFTLQPYIRRAWPWWWKRISRWTMRSTSSVAMIRWLASSGRLVLGKKAWVRSLIQTEPCLTPTNPRMCTATPPSYQLTIYFFHIVDKSKPQKLKQFPSNVQARPTLLENSTLDTTPRVFLELVVKYCWKCRGVLCLFIVWVTEEPLHCIGAQHNSVASV